VLRVFLGDHKAEQVTVESLGDLLVSDPQVDVADMPFNLTMPCVTFLRMLRLRRCASRLRCKHRAQAPDGNDHDPKIA
jgi:hypothetical protein